MENRILNIIETYEKQCFFSSNIEQEKNKFNTQFSELKKSIFNSKNIKLLRKSFFENLLDDYLEIFIREFNRNLMYHVDIDNVGKGITKEFKVNNFNTNGIQRTFKVDKHLQKEIKERFVSKFGNFCTDEEISSIVNFSKKDLRSVPLSKITFMLEEKLNQLKKENPFFVDFKGNVSCDCYVDISGNFIFGFKCDYLATFSF